MVEHARQALVGALGGTYISLAIMDIDELTVSNFALLDSADFASPMQAIERYIKSVPRVPNKVGLSVAGPVDGERARMSNLPWSFDRNDIRAITGADQIFFINEFEALALAAPRMSAYDLIELNRGQLRRTATRAVISAGTSVGTAALVWAGDKWCPLSGQSRLATFPTPLTGEFDLHAMLGSEGAVAAGEVLTGRGLVALYAGLRGKRSKLNPAQITKAGLSGEDADAVRALELMATWLGRFAGDVALHFGAAGGLFLAGGMPSNIVPALQTARFRDAFEGRGERRAYLGNVAINVIKAGADAGLRGAAIALANSLPVRPTNLRRLQA